jgi:hypothetical protein
MGEREKMNPSLIVNATKIIALTFHPLNLGVSFGHELIRVVLIRVLLYNIKILQDHPMGTRNSIFLHPNL